MIKSDLRGCAVLIVQKDLSTALDLQDAFAESGARVLTSYRPARALLHAETSQISAAVIDASLDVDDREAICKQLTTRNVPFVLYGHKQSTDSGNVRIRRSGLLRPLSGSSRSYGPVPQDVTTGGSD